MTERVQNSADVVACLEQMGREGVPEGMWRRHHGDARCGLRSLKGPLKGLVVHVVPADELRVRTMDQVFGCSTLE